MKRVIHIASLTAFFPAYNDAPSLPGLIAKTFEVLQDCADDFEVIVVNDGSHDNTGAVLAALALQYGPRRRVVTHPENRGYGRALRTGFAAAEKEWVFYIDGDGQYDVGELPELLKQVDTEVSLGNGYKLARNDPWHRICIGKLYNIFARSLFRIRLRDVDCDFRLIRRSLLKDIPLTSTSGSICVEPVRKIETSGCSVAEVGAHHFPRLYGRPQFFRVRSILTAFRESIELYVRTVLISSPARTKPVLL
ncbi:MAG TPA: glycosyltransferase family 2 protein [Bryobacteraceae bacterium]|nr:glycosyltransferase family 2 protein [Bryobacteraceae bacterium]